MQINSNNNNNNNNPLFPIAGNNINNIMNKKFTGQNRISYEMTKQQLNNERNE